MAQIRKFEVALYNETVRELVEAGEHHKHYSDQWANTEHHKHYSDQWANTYEEEVTANDLPSALLKIHTRYPPDRGFVIVNIREVKEDDPI